MVNNSITEDVLFQLIERKTDGSELFFGGLSSCSPLPLARRIARRKFQQVILINPEFNILVNLLTEEVVKAGEGVEILIISTDGCQEKGQQTSLDRLSRVVPKENIICGTSGNCLIKLLRDNQNKIIEGKKIIVADYSPLTVALSLDILGIEGAWGQEDLELLKGGPLEAVEIGDCFLRALGQFIYALSSNVKKTSYDQRKNFEDVLALLN